jgi:phenolic acid decarboxylase
MTKDKTHLANTYLFKVWVNANTIRSRPYLGLISGRWVLDFVIYFAVNLYLML